MYRAHDRHGPIIDGHVYDLKNPRRTGAPQPQHNPFHPAGSLSQPTTMTDLRRRAGVYFGMAKVHLEWSAISTWMLKGQATAAIEAAGIPYPVASATVRLIQPAREFEAGWPRLSGKVETPALYGLSPDCQLEARRVAREVAAVWTAQGRPHQSGQSIEQVLSLIAAAVRNGLLEPIPGISADPLQPAQFKRPSCADFLDRLGDRMKG
ncbi:hypothetical protein [Sphingobium sp. DN12]|uniref:hypothetical protein n=1 Tax=Sphingobium sp. DN12 TaxID=3378073 RepID=UPI003DA42FE2